MTLATATTTIYGAHVASYAFDDAITLYREIYAEPPYSEQEVDFQDFEASLPERVKQPDFHLAISRQHEATVGFALGHQLLPTTQWWHGLLSPADDEITTEYPGRTFVIIEIAVRRPYRRMGFGRTLHAHLIAGLKQERSILLVRPDAVAAQAAYRAWGYRAIGQLQPFADAPVYDAMIKSPLYL